MMQETCCTSMLIYVRRRFGRLPRPASTRTIAQIVNACGTNMHSVHVSLPAHSLHIETSCPSWLLSSATPSWQTSSSSSASSSAMGRLRGDSALGKCKIKTF